MFSRIRTNPSHTTHTTIAKKFMYWVTVMTNFSLLTGSLWSTSGKFQTRNVHKPYLLQAKKLFKIMLYFRPQFSKGWITLSTRLITIQRVSVNKTNHSIHWIVIYPVSSVIHLLNNLGQDDIAQKRLLVCLWLIIPYYLFMRGNPQQLKN